jgi:predicted RND superfamily exporter protein
MKRNWFKFAINLSGIRSGRYKIVLVVSALICAISIWQALQNRLNGDISAMLPDDAPSVQSLNDMTERFGATNFLIILFLAPPDMPLTKDLAALATDLSDSNFIKRVDFRWEVHELETHGLYYLEKEQLEKLRDTIKEKIRKETLRNNPFYVELDEEEAEDETLDEEDFTDLGKAIEQYGEGLMLEDDYVYFRKDVDCTPGKDEAQESCENVVWGMIVTPSQGAADVTYANALIDEVNQVIEARNLDPAVRVLLSGRYNYLATEADLVLSDLKRVSLIGAGLVGIVVFAFFPNVFILILIFIPLLIGIAIDFGIVHLTIGELNIVTTGNFAILFGMGVAYGVHIYSRFREERKRGHSYEDAMESAIGDTGRAAFLAAATTAVAFVSLTVAEYKGFSQLGFITSLGVAFAFLAAIIILPALGKLLARFNLLRRHKFTGSTIDDVLKRRGDPPRAYAMIVAGGMVLTVVSIYLISTFSDVYEMDYNKLQFQNEERELAHRYEKELLGMSGEPAVLAANDREDLFQLVDQLEHIRETEGSTIIEKIDSILSFIPKDQESKREVIREINDIVNQKKMDLAEGETLDQVKRLRRLTRAEPVTLDTLPDDITLRFTSNDGGYLVFAYPTHDINDIRYAIQLRDLLSAEKLGRKYGGTNPGILFAEMQDVMLGDAPRVIAITFLVVMLIVLLDFRSVRATLLALVPLVVGIVWMVGVQSAFGLKVNWLNVIAYPAVIGIGVDNGVHVLHRYRMEGPSSLRRLIRNLGRTLSVSTLTTVMGFGALMLSYHPGLKSLGLLTIVGLVSTFLAAVFFLPSLLFIYQGVITRHRLGRETDFTVWTVAHDPATRNLLKLLRQRSADFKVVTLDEIPPAEMKRQVEALRKRLDGPLNVPLLEGRNEIVSASGAKLDDASRLLDA